MNKLKQLLIEWKRQDLEILHSSGRKREGGYSHQIIKRNRWMLDYGLVPQSLRGYKRRKEDGSWERAFLLGKKLGFRKYAKIHGGVIEYIQDAIKEGKCYSLIQSELSKRKVIVSLMTISRAKNYDLTQYKPIPLETSQKTINDSNNSILINNTIYGSHDDYWQYFVTEGRKVIKKRVGVFNVCSGYDENKGKIVHYLGLKIINSLDERKSEVLNKFYKVVFNSIDKETKKFISCDSDRKLVSISRELGILIRDKFHVCRSLGTNWKRISNKVGYEEFKRGDCSKFVEGAFNHKSKLQASNTFFKFMSSKSNQCDLLNGGLTSYGGNAEGSVAHIKRIINSRVMSEAQFKGLMKANDILVID